MISSTYNALNSCSIKMSYILTCKIWCISSLPQMMGLERDKLAISDEKAEIAIEVFVNP